MVLKRLTGHHTYVVDGGPLSAWHRLRLTEELVLSKIGVPSQVDAIKKEVDAYLRACHGGMVAHGVFAGMKLLDETAWSANDGPSKLLGHYERQVVEQLVLLANPDAPFLDLGAADGYFAIGVLLAGLFRHSYCFELTRVGRQSLLRHAVANHVSDRLTIYGEATSQSLLTTIADLKSGTILCDIEGGEFELFTEVLLEECRRFNIIIELHAKLARQGESQRESLIKRASRHFNVDLLRPSSPDFKLYPELDALPDDYRLLAFSEARTSIGEWLVLTPRLSDAAED